MLLLRNTKIKIEICFGANCILGPILGGFRHCSKGTGSAAELELSAQCCSSDEYHNRKTVSTNDFQSSKTSLAVCQLQEVRDVRLKCKSDSTDTLARTCQLMFSESRKISQHSFNHCPQVTL